MYCQLLLSTNCWKSNLLLSLEIYSQVFHSLSDKVEENLWEFYESSDIDEIWRLSISIYSVYHVLLCLTINYTWSVQWRPRCISCSKQCVCGLDNLLPLITCRRMAAGGAISGRHSHTPASSSPLAWVWSRSETVVTCSALSTTRLTPDWYADTCTVTLLFRPLLSQRSTRLREFCPFLCQI